jgi:hypothetical protein
MFKSFTDFCSMNEAEPKGKEKGTVKPPEEAADTSEGTLKKMKIDGKEYNAVLSTYNAIASKQAAIGETEVGMITLPGKKQVWELLPTEEGEEEKTEEKPEESKEENK